MRNCHFWHEFRSICNPFSTPSFHFNVLSTMHCCPWLFGIYTNLPSTTPLITAAFYCISNSLFRCESHSLPVLLASFAVAYINLQLLNLVWKLSRKTAVLWSYCNYIQVIELPWVNMLNAASKVGAHVASLFPFLYFPHGSMLCKILSTPIFFLSCWN